MILIGVWASMWIEMIENLRICFCLFDSCAGSYSSTSQSIPAATDGNNQQFERYMNDCYINTVPQCYTIKMARHSLRNDTLYNVLTLG